MKMMQRGGGLARSRQQPQQPPLAGFLPGLQLHAALRMFERARQPSAAFMLRGQRFFQRQRVAMACLAPLLHPAREAPAEITGAVAHEWPAIQRGALFQHFRRDVPVWEQEWFEVEPVVGVTVEGDAARIRFQVGRHAPGRGQQAAQPQQGLAQVMQRAFALHAGPEQIGQILPHVAVSRRGGEIGEQQQPLVAAGGGQGRSAVADIDRTEQAHSEHGAILAPRFAPIDDPA